MIFWLKAKDTENNDTMRILILQEGILLKIRDFDPQYRVEIQ